MTYAIIATVDSNLLQAFVKENATISNCTVNGTDAGTVDTGGALGQVTTFNIALAAVGFAVVIVAIVGFVSCCRKSAGCFCCVSDQQFFCAFSTYYQKNSTFFLSFLPCLPFSKLFQLFALDLAQYALLLILFVVAEAAIVIVYFAVPSIFQQVLQEAFKCAGQLGLDQFISLLSTYGSVAPYIAIGIVGVQVNAKKRSTLFCP